MLASTRHEPTLHRPSLRSLRVLLPPFSRDPPASTTSRALVRRRYQVNSTGRAVPALRYPAWLSSHGLSAGGQAEDVIPIHKTFPRPPTRPEDQGAGTIPHP